VGERVATARGRPGAAWYHVVRDLVAACHEIARGDFSSLRPRAGRGPVIYAALSADDPLPGLVDLPLTAWRALARRLAPRAGRDEAGPTPFPELPNLPDVAPGV
jgi:predicted ATP-grasp superfamily ATP-dependent carboligase